MPIRPHGHLALVFLSISLLLFSGCSCLDLIDGLTSGGAPSTLFAPSPSPSPSVSSPDPARPPAASPTPAAANVRPPPPPPFTPKPPPTPPPAGTRVSQRGTLTLGPVTQLGSQTVSGGADITLQAPGHSLSGMVISVPQGAYAAATTFKVSSAPVAANTFKYVTPVSPLISIDNGGAYADNYMEVKVPVKLTPNQFAMGFIYDKATGTLEGMPLVGRDANSVTVATMHFSDFFISAIDASLLSGDIDSGFRPGIDDWQFPNEGSYIQPGGHCAGQAVTALWYYVTRPDGKDANLYGRYDRNGEKPATPLLWMDDTWGYRLCSVVQRDIAWSSFHVKFWRNLKASDETTWRLFAYSMRVTGEPQQVGIYSSAGGGHAMIVYRIKDGHLYIADPNYPGDNNRRIEFVNGAFKPYNSGANASAIAAGEGTSFETIIYRAKTSTVRWDRIAARWQELKAGTIGNAQFPQKEIGYWDATGWKALKDGIIFNSDKLEPALFEGDAIDVYRDQSYLFPDDKNRVTLQPGDNRLGFYYRKKISGVYAYVNFVYINVRYQPPAASPSPKPSPTPTPTPTASAKLAITTTQMPAGKVGVPYQATLRASGGKAPYQWTVTTGLEGSFDVSKDGVITGTPKAAGTYSFVAHVEDSSNPPQVASKMLSITVARP